MDSLWHIWIASITPLMLWGHYWVKWGWLGHKPCDTSTVIVVTEWQTGGMCRTKERFTFWAGGSRTVRASNHTPQNDRQFKTYELFSSGIFHLIFSVNNWQVTETTESDTWDRRGWPCPVVPLGGKSTRRRGHLKPEVVVKWPISSHVRKRKHHHNPRKKPEGPNPEMKTVTMLRSSLLEWSTSMRMLKPSLSEWFQVQSQSFLTFWTEWPGTHLQKERRGTLVQIPSEHCNLQI